MEVGLPSSPSFIIGLGMLTRSDKKQMKASEWRRCRYDVVAQSETEAAAGGEAALLAGRTLLPQAIPHNVTCPGVVCLFFGPLTTRSPSTWRSGSPLPLSATWTTVTRLVTAPLMNNAACIAALKNGHWALGILFASIEPCDPLPAPWKTRMHLGRCTSCLKSALQIRSA